MKKRMLSLVFAALLTLSVTACSNQNEKKQNATDARNTDVTQDVAQEPVIKQVTPAEMVATASQKLGQAKNMKASTRMDMQTSQEALNMSILMDMTCFSDPLKMHVGASVDLGEAGATNMDIYCKADNGQYRFYLSDGQDWVTDTVTMEDIKQYDVRESLKLYLSSSTEFQSAGTEELSDGTADKLTGLIKGDKLGEILENNGLLETLGDDLIDDEDTALSGLPDTPVTLWINQATGYPVQLEVDMTETMNQLFSKVLDNEELSSLSFQKIQIHLTCSDFDAAPDFEIPAEALSATNLDDIDDIDDMDDADDDE